jgi:alpha-galactosidase
MMRHTKIVIIGAGSASFGMACLSDAFLTKEIWGSELVLVDLDQPALERMARAANRINEELHAGFQISSYTDRRQALACADFVITSIAINRIPLWKQDFAVPKKHGIPHVLGENGGPGALFHTMRNIPVILGICRDMEELCPDALLINFTNPESRICLAVRKYTKIKAIGLCHQIGEGLRIIGKIMGREPEDLDVKACGLNHFTWFMDIRDKNTGEDLYPLLREKERAFDPEFEKLSRFMFHKFGLFPTSGDGHLGEYLPYAHELAYSGGYDYAAYENRRDDSVVLLDGIGSGTIALDEKNLKHSGEKAFTIIKGIVANTNEVIEAVNLPNNGYISNLPDDAIVEVPAVVCGSGVRGIGMGALPRGIAALCMGQINVQHLVVDAGALGDKELAMQAMLVDPNVPSANAAIAIFDELMEIDKLYLPQFRQ